MRLPDWQDLVLEPEIFPEPTGDENRLVLWIPGHRDARFQYWERLSSAPRAEVRDESGVLTMAVTMIPARQDLRGLLGRLFEFGIGEKDRRSFLLPNGRSVVQSGPRGSDALLVWSEEAGTELTADLIAARWPEARGARKLGRNLYVVSRVAIPSAEAPAPEAEVGAVVPGGSPREQAERLLESARRTGDRRGEASALADLGVIGLNEANAKGAFGALQSALAIARELGDPDREHDILGNLGVALLGLRDPRQAWALFDRQLAYARSRGDRYGEKLALERLGMASWSVGDSARALQFYDQALVLARAVGDRQQESNLLWHQAILHAELGQRDQAIERGEESVGLLKKLGRPQAGWYGSALQKYRVGATASFSPAGVGTDPRAYLGGSIVSSVMAGSGAVGGVSNQDSQGPGLLRMAMSASKAMANFVGGGLQATSVAVQEQRQKVCSTCEHHTGLRCKICGCFTNLKSRMAHEDCPIGKWPAQP